MFGWLFELWRIPDYVRTANAEMDQAESILQWSGVRVPSVRIKRVIGEFVVSFYLSYLATSALPDEILNDFLWTSTISAFAVAIGKTIKLMYTLFIVYIYLCFYAFHSLISDAFSILLALLIFLYKFMYVFKQDIDFKSKEASYF